MAKMYGANDAVSAEFDLMSFRGLGGSAARGMGTIAGTRFENLDRNSRQDGNDRGRSGWRVFLDANDNDPTDDYDHGTHTAGTIGAAGDNGVGVTGVNWDVALMTLKFIDANNHGTSFDATRALEYATMMGAKVTNDSYGVGPDNALYDAIAAGGLFVAAGVHVMSTVPIANGSYAYFNGTSMATPHVAAAVALLMSLDPTLSLAEIKAALLNGVTPLAGLQDKVLAGGELDLLGALNALSDQARAVTVVAGRTETVDFAAHGAATRDGDALQGFDLAERIVGHQGDDVISGGGGGDMLIGGAGDDRLYGGTGADRFSFNERSGADTIGDFSTAEHDRILIRTSGARVRRPQHRSRRARRDDRGVRLGADRRAGREARDAQRHR